MRIWTMEHVIAELKWKVLKALSIQAFDEAASALYYEAKDGNSIPTEIRMSGPKALQLRNIILDASTPFVGKWKATMELFSVRFKLWL